MNLKIVNKITPTLTPSDHPYLNGAWAPLHEEVDATEMEVIGEIPKDLSGVYVRNTENPVHDAIGTYPLTVTAWSTPYPSRMARRPIEIDLFKPKGFLRSGKPVIRSGVAYLATLKSLCVPGGVQGVI